MTSCRDCWELLCFQTKVFVNICCSTDDNEYPIRNADPPCMQHPNICPEYSSQCTPYEPCPPVRLPSVDMPCQMTDNANDTEKPTSSKRIER